MIALIASAALSATPILVERSDCWALGWTDPRGVARVVAAHESDTRTFREALLTASGLLWYPWIAPSRDGPGQTTPMQDCFREARETCRSQGEQVCFAYFIQYGGGGSGCFFGCSVNGVCGEPPPIPPVPAGVDANEHMVLASLVQEASAALLHED